MDWNKEQSINYWNSYYESHACPDGPSLFAEFCLEKIEKPCKLLDLGCGNGRDSKFFARNGVNVIACDQSQIALKELDGINNISVLNSDIGDLEKNYKGKIDVLYSRFSLHAVDEITAHDALEWGYQHLTPGGKLFLEVRSCDDPHYGEGVQVDDNAFVTDHYRRFVTLDSLHHELERIGYRVEYEVCKRGFAPFKDEDPKVIRIIASCNYT